MAKPRFVYGITELAFSRCLTYDSYRSSEAMQAVDRTGAGSLEVEILGPSIRQRQISFRGMPLIDYTALFNWCENVCEWSANAFTYWDEDGNPSSVRLLTSKLAPPWRGYNSYNVDLLLEVES